MQTQRPSRAANVLAAGVATLVLLGAAPAAHANPVSRAQAVRKAHDYLGYQAFSYKGLIAQLKYEGFSTADATYGASHVGANWSKQAAAKAKDYLKFQAFSRSGLIAQLEYEGFTPAQAAYGARAVGL